MSYEERLNELIISDTGPPGRPFVWAQDARSLVRDMGADLATADADCAALREALQEIHDAADRKGFTAERGSDMEHYCAHFCTLVDAALTGRPTGQTIMDELSAARKVCEAARKASAEMLIELGDFASEAALDEALATYDAARKANTGDKQ